VSGASIAVGANNYPWLIRPDMEVVYGVPTFNCGSGICVPTMQWVDTRHTGLKIFVDLTGAAYIADGLGGIAGWSWPYSTWLHFSPMFAGPGIPACTRGFVATYAVESPQTISPAANFSPEFVSTFWHLDCSTSQRLWEWDANMSNDPVHGISFENALWSQIDNGDGTTLALFSSASPIGTISQTPWIVVRGHAWAWNGSSMTATPYPANKYEVKYVTDGYALTTDSSVWRWNGSIYGSSAGTPWSLVAQAPANVTFSKVAASFGVPGLASPSQIWALDTNGNLYRLDGFDPTPVR
ncbi:MAG TPA: hypothetical protein VGL19_13405, partial [Polyangiaceae bacterium]